MFQKLVIESIETAANNLLFVGFQAISQTGRAVSDGSLSFNCIKTDSLRLRVSVRDIIKRQYDLLLRDMATSSILEEKTDVAAVETKSNSSLDELRDNSDSD